MGINFGKLFRTVKGIARMDPRVDAGFDIVDRVESEIKKGKEKPKAKPKRPF